MNHCIRNQRKMHIRTKRNLYYVMAYMLIQVLKCDSKNIFLSRIWISRTFSWFFLGNWIPYFFNIREIFFHIFPDFPDFSLMVGSLNCPSELIRFWSCYVDFPDFGAPLTLWNWSYLGFLGIIWRTPGSKCQGGRGGIFLMYRVEFCPVPSWLPSIL